MSAIKLLARPVSSIGLFWKTSRQTQIVMSKTSRSISSVIFNYSLNNHKHNLKPSRPIVMMRAASTETKFEVINIQDEEDFQTRVICASDSVPVIVDFHATWCGPCKILAPRLESIVSKKGGKVTLAKVDIDDNQDLAIEYGVRSVPTVVGIKCGKRTSQFIGVIDDDQIDSFVEKLVIS